MSESIANTKYRWMPLDSKNTLMITFNEATQVVTVDLVAGNEVGGNEIYREKINQKKLLEHANDATKG